MELARACQGGVEFVNFDMVGESYVVDMTGSSVLAAALHCPAALLLRQAHATWARRRASVDMPSSPLGRLSVPPSTVLEYIHEALVS